MLPPQSKVGGEVGVRGKKPKKVELSPPRTGSSVDRRKVSWENGEAERGLQDYIRGVNPSRPLPVKGAPASSVLGRGAQLKKGRGETSSPKTHLRKNGLDPTVGETATWGTTPTRGLGPLKRKHGPLKDWGFQTSGSREMPMGTGECAENCLPSKKKMPFTARGGGGGGVPEFRTGRYTGNRPFFGLSQ